MAKLNETGLISFDGNKALTVLFRSLHPSLQLEIIENIRVLKSVVFTDNGYMEVIGYSSERTIKENIVELHISLHEIMSVTGQLEKAVGNVN